jgi:hypothetical protein
LTPDKEQRLLFSELDSHLARMALLKVNTGLREHEEVSLRWSWEAKVRDLDTSESLLVLLGVHLLRSHSSAAAKAARLKSGYGIAPKRYTPNRQFSNALPSPSATTSPASSRPNVSGVPGGRG